MDITIHNEMTPKSYRLTDEDIDQIEHVCSILSTLINNDFELSEHYVPLGEAYRALDVIKDFNDTLITSDPEDEKGMYIID